MLVKPRLGRSCHEPGVSAMYGLLLYEASHWALEAHMLQVQPLPAHLQQFSSSDKPILPLELQALQCPAPDFC
jgi:hypothetical protein